MDYCRRIIELFVDGIYLDNKITRQWKYIIDEDWVYEFEDGSILNQTPGKSFEMSRSILHRVTEITSGVRYSLHYGLNKYI